jgi:hypothetical protein
MNKKGMLGGYLGIFVIITVIIILSISQNELNVANEELIKKNLTDSAISVLNWSKIGANVSESIERTSQTQGYYGYVIFQVIKRYIDFVGYSVMAIAQLAMRYAADNPDIINFKILMGLVILSLLAPLIYPAFIIIISLFLIMKEWFLLRKERKGLKK